jgi:hypothetical protein
MANLIQSDELPKALLDKRKWRYRNLQTEAIVQGDGFLNALGRTFKAAGRVLPNSIHPFRPEYKDYLAKNPYLNIGNSTIEGKNPWTWMIENRIRENRFDDCIKHEIKNKHIPKFDDNILKVLAENFRKDLQIAKYLGGNKAEKVLSRYSKYCMGIMPSILDIKDKIDSKYLKYITSEDAELLVNTLSPVVSKEEDKRVQFTLNVMNKLESQLEEFQEQEELKKEEEQIRSNTEKFQNVLTGLLKNNTYLRCLTRGVIKNLFNTAENKHGYTESSLIHDNSRKSKLLKNFSIEFQNECEKQGLFTLNTDPKADKAVGMRTKWANTFAKNNKIKIDEILRNSGWAR